MPDPLTLGAIASLALGIGAEAVLKGAVSEAVKDAYKTLRERIAKWSEPEILALESSPASPGRRAVIAEIVDSRPPGDFESLRVLVENLIAHLSRASEGAAVGIDIGTLHAARVRLGNIVVKEGSGFRADHVNVAGDFETGDVRVGSFTGRKDRSSPTPNTIGAVLGHTVAGGDVLVGNRVAVRGDLHLHSPTLASEAVGRLEVTDILVDSYRADFTAVLDFRLINRGDKSVSISRARFMVVDVEEVHTLGYLDFPRATILTLVV